MMSADTAACRHGRGADEIAAEVSGAALTFIALMPTQLMTMSIQYVGTTVARAMPCLLSESQFVATAFLRSAGQRYYVTSRPSVIAMARRSYAARRWVIGGMPARLDVAGPIRPLPPGRRSPRRA